VLDGRGVGDQGVVKLSRTLVDGTWPRLRLLSLANNELSSTAALLMAGCLRERLAPANDALAGLRVRLLEGNTNIKERVATKLAAAFPGAFM
jgi:hypothetical protein